MSAEVSQCYFLVSEKLTLGTGSQPIACNRHRWPYGLEAKKPGLYVVFTVLLVVVIGKVGKVNKLVNSHAQQCLFRDFQCKLAGFLNVYLFMDASDICHCSGIHCS